MWLPPPAPVVIDGELPGDYRPLSCDRVYRDGSIEAVGLCRMAGRLHYGADGRMWVLLLRSPRRGPHDSAHDGSGRSPARALLGYCGTYTATPHDRIVVHQVQAAIDTRWVGQCLARGYERLGDLLVLTVRGDAFDLRTTFERG